MRSKSGTGVNVPLFAHMIDPDEVPLFPQSLVVEQPSSSSPIIHPISSPQRDDHELFSRFSSMSHSELSRGLLSLTYVRMAPGVSVDDLKQHLKRSYEGASGKAIQYLNLIMGIPENTGLSGKPLF
ncbi:hypothetical protein L1987_46173 [Smallanthus sonchifolius]|uniref:Uncharacterized protein n=1 Tax=Smallanthus sonchifolius TaxID=185202 RepID=A0ACB9FZ02_9ASTR|nr:hypothetical protein L1987_46173 [Smallanthus sonchifolius]